VMRASSPARRCGSATTPSRCERRHHIQSPTARLGSSPGIRSRSSRTYLVEYGRAASCQARPAAARRDRLRSAPPGRSTEADDGRSSAAGGCCASLAALVAGSPTGDATNAALVANGAARVADCRLPWLGGRCCRKKSACWHCALRLRTRVAGTWIGTAQQIPVGRPSAPSGRATSHLRPGWRF
jgi:hypothetical protein